MTSIKPIDQGSVHRLHSGQVVLDLQGAIKELVENSLDAGATSIEVRIKDSGLDTVEIVDNGSGIGPDDWDFIGRKHHTSKLSDIALIASVTTFGFRGEALSSLCALCEDVTVVTATKEMAPMGAVLKFNRDGTLKDSTGRVARPRGTTVTLSGLFVPLPVRRKEFERTAKREYTKALNLLYAYALVPASSSRDGINGVRLKVEAVGAGRSGKRSAILTTDGRGSLRSSVTAIWGSKALEGVLDVDLKLDFETDSIMTRREGLSLGLQQVKVDGLISSAAWGQGRSSPDRQFIYINNRPCDLKIVTKTINEVYKSFNTHQVPLVILNFHIPPESMDINVSPDKRTILLHSESNFISVLREGLEQFFAPSRSDFQLAGASQTVKVIQPTQTLLSLSYPSDADLQTSGMNNDQREEDAPGGDTDIGTGEGEPDEVMIANQQPRDPESEIPTRRRSNRAANQSGRRDSSFEEIIEVSSQRSNTDLPRNGSSRVQRPLVQEITFEEDVDSSAKVRSASRLQSYHPSPSPPRAIKRTLDTTVASWSPERRSARQNATETAEKGKQAASVLRNRLARFASQSVPEDHGSPEDRPTDGETSDEELPDGVTPNNETASTKASIEDSHVDEASQRTSRRIGERHVRESEELEEISEDVPMSDGVEVLEKDNVRPDSPVKTTRPSHSSPKSSTNEAPVLPHRTSSDNRNEITSTSIQGELILHFNLPRLRSRYANRQTSVGNQAKDATTRLTEGSVATAAGIMNRDSAQAEQALSRVIQKSDFGRMEVLGQFNKGFIIARLRRSSIPDDKGQTNRKETDDLFIIDQHASDEKYNFETLQNTTIIKSQRLIKPRALQLTAGDEITAIENLDTLKANGFEVSIDEDKAPGRGERVQLTAMPVSKDTTFDFKDLEQLLHLLSESSHQKDRIVRPQKTRAMFAMRACRKSVMIGKPLTVPQMTLLLRNMGTIDQPWNCPHGRPTMRHLLQIEAPSTSRAGLDRIDWGKWKRERQHASH